MIPDFRHFERGAERMAQAMTGIPDRVPVFAQMHEFAAERRGIPRREFFTRPDLLVPAVLRTQADFGIDVPSITFDVYNIEAEALGQPLAWTEQGFPIECEGYSYEYDCDFDEVTGTRTRIPIER